MNDLFQGLIMAITGEGSLDFANLLQLFLLYLVALWVAFCVWVFYDAQKRFGSVIKAGLTALIVFTLNFPALIVYMIIRPDDFTEDYYDGIAPGGVQVPLVQFTGEDGSVKMSFNLHLSKEMTNTPDLHIGMGTSVASPAGRNEVQAVVEELKEEPEDVEMLPIAVEPEVPTRQRKSQPGILSQVGSSVLNGFARVGGVAIDTTKQGWRVTTSSVRKLKPKNSDLHSRLSTATDVRPSIVEELSSTNPAVEESEVQEETKSAKSKKSKRNKKGKRK